jgi:hypothetical protein
MDQWQESIGTARGDCLLQAAQLKHGLGHSSARQKSRDGCSAPAWRMAGNFRETAGRLLANCRTTALQLLGNCSAGRSSAQGPSQAHSRSHAQALPVTISLRERFRLPLLSPHAS